jgi:hypothetical protein
MHGPRGGPRLRSRHGGRPGGRRSLPGPGPEGNRAPPASPPPAAAISALVVLRTPETAGAAAGRAGAAGAPDITRLDVEAAQAFFRKAGFEVTDVYAISFSITGPRTVFEATFGEAIAPEGTGPATIATAPGRLGLRLDRLPEPVTRAVAAVTFSPPPAFGPTRY